MHEQKTVSLERVGITLKILSEIQLRIQQIVLGSEKIDFNGLKCVSSYFFKKIFNIYCQIKIYLIEFTSKEF